MPTDKPRFSITVDQNLSNAIDDYKYKTRAKNQTQAVVELIERGLDSLDQKPTETKKSPAPEGTEDEKAVVSLEQSTRFLVAMGLIREGEQLSDRDVEFLEHLVGLLRAWFAEHKAKNR